MATTLGDRLNDIFQDIISLADEREYELEDKIDNLESDLMDKQEEINSLSDEVETLKGEIQELQEINGN